MDGLFCLRSTTTYSGTIDAVGGRPHQQQMRWSRRGADLLLQVRCAVYNGMFGPGFGHRFDRLAGADAAFAEAA
jgi:hypothetical protein